MKFKDFVIKWNNENKHDFWWRKKYNVTFNSEKHREQTLISIAFEYWENKLLDKWTEENKLQEEKEKKIKEGIWINSKESSKEEDDLLWAKMGEANK